MQGATIDMIPDLKGKLPTDERKRQDGGGGPEVKAEGGGGHED